MLEPQNAENVLNLVVDTDVRDAILLAGQKGIGLPRVRVLRPEWQVLLQNGQLEDLRAVLWDLFHADVVVAGQVRVDIRKDEVKEDSHLLLDLRLILLLSVQVHFDVVVVVWLTPLVNKVLDDELGQARGCAVDHHLRIVQEVVNDLLLVGILRLPRVEVLFDEHLLALAVQLRQTEVSQNAGAVADDLSLADLDVRRAQASELETNLLGFFSAFEHIDFVHGVADFVEVEQSAYCPGLWHKRAAMHRNCVFVSLIHFEL